MDGESQITRHRMPSYALGGPRMTVAALVLLYQAEYLAFGALIWILDAPRVMYA
jgi:hypothetical protein